MNSSDISSKVHRLEDYAPPVWTTPEIALRFDLDIERTLVRAEYKVHFNEIGFVPELPSLFLNGVSLHLISVRVNGLLCEPNQYRITSLGLELFKPPAKDFTLLIENSISPKSNTALEGLYHSGKMLCTQNEPEGFRKIIYCIDRPDNLSIFTVTLCGDQSSYPILLSNGNLISTRVLDNGKHEAVWFDPFPKPSYLFALVAGNLAHVSDRFVTSSGRAIELRIFVDEKNIEKTEFAMTSLKEAMRWDEETFGLEYDLDLFMIVAVDDFNMGAMENKGLNLFNSKLVLADKKSATDETFESILGVVAHEYFHNWTGNRVTLRNWFNLTLKEGLTVFRDQWFTEDKTDASVKRIADVLFLKEHQFAEDAGPISHPILPKFYVEMNNFYTVTVYEKGAEVIRMLSLLIGRETFKKGLSHYLKEYDGQGVTYEEFISSMEFVSKKNLDLFRNWYHRKGTPNFKINEIWNDTTGDYSLEFIDMDAEALSLSFPMSVALFTEEGKIKHEEILEVKGKSFQRTWKNFSSKPIISLQRSFSAPIKIHIDRNIREYSFLAKYESEGVSRFFALQEVIFETLGKQFQNDSPAATLDLFSILDEIFREKEKIAKDFLSYLLNVPSLTQIADVLKCYDYEIIFSLREKLISLVAMRYQDQFQALYDENSETIPIQSRLEIGKRRLKNLSLSYLLHIGNIRDEMSEKALIQQRNAKHMSEELSALRFLCEGEDSNRERSVADFYEKWKADPLVLDYWFSAQVSYGKNARERAESLLKLTEFRFENPNRVRALLGAFARNPRSFHHLDGSGYLFMGAALEKLNYINPQIAANLGKLFQSIRLQPEKPKEIAKMEIERILKIKDLSNDLEEVLSKILKGL